MKTMQMVIFKVLTPLVKFLMKTMQMVIFKLLPPW